MRRSRRLLAALLAMLMVAAVLAGCAKKAEQPPASEPAPTGDQPAPTPAKTEVPQEINFNLGEEPPSLDPATMTDLTSFAVVNSVFEGLVRIEPDGIKPGMATEWTISPDQTEYTFKLRDAKWHNGDPVTAEDFVFAWKRALDPRTASDYAYQLYYIAGGQEFNSGELPKDDDAADVKAQKEAKLKELSDAVQAHALDPKTLHVKLVAPTPYFLGLTSFPTLMPVNKKVVEADAAWASEATNYVGNGPFKLTEWSHKDKLVLVKNADYWDAATVRLTQITMPMIVEEGTAITMYENDELDSNDRIPNTDLPRLVAEGNAVIGPYIGTYYYLVNHTKKPFDDLRVRQALALAIDRKAIVENITQAGELPAYAYVPPGFPNPVTNKDFRAEGGDWFQEDLAKAKQLLSDAGFANGQGFPAFTLVYNTSEGHKAIAEAIQAMWKDNLGITNITLQNQDWGVFLDTRSSLNYDVARAGWIGDYLDPMTFIDMWISGSGNNDTGWSSAEYDQLVNTAKTTSDQTVRFDAMHKAEEMLEKDMVVIPIYYYTNQWQDKPWLKGIFRTALGVTDFRWAYVEEH